MEYREPQHGVDYLIDFYAFLEVARDADEQSIEHAVRQKTKEYHTDQYRHLAAGLRRQAEEKMQIVNQAKTTLLSPQTRPEYDKQLAAWTGPISTDGTPIINLGDPSFSSLSLLSGAIEDPDFAKEQRILIAQFSGHDANTFTLLEKLCKESPNPPPELAAAYREALRKRDLYLELELGLVWEAVGYHNRPPETQMTSNYSAHLEEELSAICAKIVGDVEKKLALVQGGELKALGPGGEELTRALADDPKSAIVRYREEIGRRFEIGAERIRDFARQRQELIEMRLETIDWKYWPEQSEFFPRLLVKVNLGENSTWLAFRLVDENKVVTDDSVDTSVIAPGFVSQESAKTWIERGYNIITVTLEDNIKASEQLQVVVSKHFERFIGE